ncbi:hypothetical protein F5882DRAFT_437348, partial [Hyaloscypha sp. PMI_1271]
MSQVTCSALRKICATCGRQISWRKKWEKNWHAITYCSDSCRKNKIRPNSLDTMFESKILSLLSRRRIIQGLTATVTCEEAEREVLQDKKNFQPDEGSSGTAFQSSLEGTKAASEPSRTRER